MLSIKKQIVTDEAFQPVAVIINYQDWQRIEAFLLRQEQDILQQLESTEAVVWSPQADRQGVQGFSDMFPIMQLAETGFAEWNDPEEDIYNDVA